MRDSFQKKSKLDSTQGKFCCLFFAMLFINRMCCFFANKLGCIVVDLVFICLASFFCHVYIILDLGFYSHEIF
jgi:hypothetical protein